MEFVITRADGSARKVSGYRYAAPRPGTKLFASARPKSALPKKVDLRTFMTPVENQGQTNSCAANAVAGAYEYLVKRHLGEDAYDVSRMFIYYNGRRVDGVEGEDDGSVIGSLIESLKSDGACSERTWPFDEGAVNDEPSDEAYEEAANFLVEDASLVDIDTPAWKQALAEGYPIIFGISLFESFDRHKKPGLVPRPSARESSRESHGGHAMLAVGYSDPDQVFIVRNSWGTEWGDGGYCYIPYDYLCNPKYNGGDAWIIRRVDAVAAEEAWSEDDETMLPELESELASMSDDDYSALLDACGDVPLESRLAHLFLVVSGQDGEVAEDELAALAEKMASLLEQLGSPLSPEKVLRFAAKHIGSEKLFEGTVAIFGEHLSNAMLASLISTARDIAGADEVEASEQDLIDRLVSAWQIEEGEDGAAEAEEDEESDSDDSDDEDEGEEDEGEEDEGDEDEGEEDDEESDSGEDE